MKNIKDKLSRLQYLNEQIPRLDKTIARLGDYAEQKKPARGSGYIAIYDETGHNDRGLDSHHLLKYPGAIRELLQLRLQDLEKERDELQNVLDVADRLFASIAESK